MNKIKSNHLQQDKWLEIVVEYHRRQIMETYMDYLVELIHVIFEVNELDVNPLYHLID